MSVMIDTVTYPPGSIHKSHEGRSDSVNCLTEWLLRDDVTQHINEDVRYSIIIALTKLFQNTDNEILVFPSSFSALERGFTRIIARILGLRAISFGSGQKRCLTVSRVPALSTIPSRLRLPLTWNSRRAIGQLLQANPLTSKERLELHPRTEGTAIVDRGNREERQRGTTGRLMGAVPQAPPPPPPPPPPPSTAAVVTAATGVSMASSPFANTCSTQSPAILSYRGQIVRHLEAGQVLIVFGPPGCGKTTYLPQILMEHCYNRGQRCRMICTQPRRLYAHINAERLAQLRGETVGQTVGYQIRLESKVSPRTLLTFCTHGVLLRTIYADPGLMTGTTHIIVDEIEEDELPTQLPMTDRGGTISSAPVDGLTRVQSNTPRDPTHAAAQSSNGCGILLGLLPSLLAQYPHLKVILLVNLRKSTFDCWPPVMGESALATAHSNIVRTDETHVPRAQHTLCRENEYEAAGYRRLLILEDTVNPHTGQDVAQKSRSAFHTFDAQDSRDHSYFGAGLSQRGGDAVVGGGVTSLTLTHIPRPDYNPDRRSAVAMQVTQLDPAAISSSSLDPCGYRTQSRRDRSSVSCVDLISAYFGRAPVVTIPFPEQATKVYHLEDILQWVAYWNASMEEASNVLWQDELRCQTLVHWLAGDLPLSSVRGSTVSDVNRPREPWQCGRTNERRGTHECDPNNPQWAEHRVFSDGDMTTTVPLLKTSGSINPVATDSKRTAQSTDHTANVLHQLSTGFSSNSRQHANNLLWSIWRGTVLSRCSEQDINPAQSYTPSQDVQALITNLHQCILAGWFPVDYQHSLSGLTALMVCSAAGLLDSVERLLGFGADVFLRVPMPYEILQARTRGSSSIDHNLAGPKHRRITIDEDTSYVVVGVNAYDLARLFGHIQVVTTLEKHMIAHSLRHIPENWEAVLLRFGAWFDSPLNACPFNLCRVPNNPSDGSAPNDTIPLSEDGNSSSSSSSSTAAAVAATTASTVDYENALLTAYQVARNAVEPETVVDFELLIWLLTKLDASVPEGSILIFLPSYEEIIYLRERLISSDASPWGHNDSKHLVLILHSRMLVADLTRVYAKAPDGFRKIILSSNIAESCMTFDDVRYIIDCGLDCSKDYVKSLGSTVLRNHWISKSIAVQRQTRVGLGQTGLCFRLYSRIRFENLSNNQSVPTRGHYIEEACIQARLLAPSNVAIRTVLSAVPRPPSSAACVEAVRSLVEMDALDSFQDLTELGYHICDIPIPPRYAKMVLVSVALKCLDPILTIACILTYAEPFVTPKNATERREMLNARKKFSADAFSDHMMLLRTFQFWQKARSEGWEKSFCQKNFISTAAFEIITVIRTQLLGQLRASGFVKARGSGDIRDLNTNSENWAVVKAAIVAGMHAHFVRVDRDQGRLFRVGSSGSHTVQLHPQSVLATNADGTPINLSVLPCDWLVYDELLTLSSDQARANVLADSEDEDSASELAQHGVAGSIDCTNSAIGAAATTTNAEYNNPVGCYPARPTQSEATRHTERDNRPSLELVRCATVVSPITIALMAGPMRLRPELLRVTENAIYDVRTAQLGYQQRQAQLVSHPFVNQTALGSRPNPLFSEWTQSAQLINSSGRTGTRTAGLSSGLPQRLDQVAVADSNEPYSDSDSEEVWSALTANGRLNLNPVLSNELPVSMDQAGVTSQKRLDLPNAQLPFCSKSLRANSDQTGNSSNSGSNTINGSTPMLNFSTSLKYQSQGGTGCVGMPNIGTMELSSSVNNFGDSDLVPVRFDDCELLHFHADSVAAQMILSLRQKWQALLLRRLRNPGKQCSQQDEAILSALVTVLTSEEQVLGLRQPSGVGARPRPMAVELCNQYEISSTAPTTNTTTTTSGTISVTSSPNSTYLTAGLTDGAGIPVQRTGQVCPIGTSTLGYASGQHQTISCPYTIGTQMSQQQLITSQRVQTAFAKSPAINQANEEPLTTRVQPLGTSVRDSVNPFPALHIWSSDSKRSDPGQPHIGEPPMVSLGPGSFSSIQAPGAQCITPQTTSTVQSNVESMVRRDWSSAATVTRDPHTDQAATNILSAKLTTRLDAPLAAGSFVTVQNSAPNFAERLIHSEPLLPLVPSSAQCDERPSSDCAADTSNRAGTGAAAIRTTIPALSTQQQTLVR